MIRKTIVKYHSKANDRIEAGMAHFKARFGNDEDIRIIKEYGRIKKMIEEIDATSYRKLELERLENKMTDKMKSIREREAALWKSLKKRKA